MKSSKGFTLIELVVVIVVLSIIAIMAVPKFIGVTGEAREATLESMIGTINSANAGHFAQAAAQGRENFEGFVSTYTDADGNTVTSAYHKGSIVMSKDELAKFIETDLFVEDSREWGKGGYDGVYISITQDVGQDAEPFEQCNIHVRNTDELAKLEFIRNFDGCWTGNVSNVASEAVKEFKDKLPFMPLAFAVGALVVMGVSATQRHSKGD